MARQKRHLLRKKFVELFVGNKGRHHKPKRPPLKREGQLAFWVRKLDPKVHKLQQHPGSPPPLQQKVAAQKASVWLAQGWVSDVLQLRQILKLRRVMQRLPHQRVYGVYVERRPHPLVPLRHHKTKPSQKPLQLLCPQQGKKDAASELPPPDHYKNVLNKRNALLLFFSCTLISSNSQPNSRQTPQTGYLFSGRLL